jgi:hypothetical protein
MGRNTEVQRQQAAQHFMASSGAHCKAHLYDLCKKYDIALYTLEDLERDWEAARELGL